MIIEENGKCGGGREGGRGGLGRNGDPCGFSRRFVRWRGESGSERGGQKGLLTSPLSFLSSSFGVTNYKLTT
jgi:hypothetical protein